MLHYLLLIDGPPHYIFCSDEDDVVKQSKEYEGVIGVVHAEGGLELLQIETEVRLRPHRVKPAPQLVEVEKGVFQEVPDDDDDDLEDNYEESLMED